VQIEVALGGEQRRCWADRQLLCEQDDGVYCYTGRSVGTASIKLQRKVEEYWKTIKLDMTSMNNYDSAKQALRG